MLSAKHLLLKHKLPLLCALTLHFTPSPQADVPPPASATLFEVWELQLRPSVCKGRGSKEGGGRGGGRGGGGGAGSVFGGWFHGQRPLSWDGPLLSRAQAEAGESPAQDQNMQIHSSLNTHLSICAHTHHINVGQTARNASTTWAA